MKPFRRVASIDQEVFANSCHILPSSWLTDRIVTITVGPEEKRWVVHEKLLINHSKFFKDHFADGDEEMRLPDDEPKLFALFIRWLYGTAFLPSGGARNFRFLQPDGTTLTVRD